MLKAQKVHDNQCHPTTQWFQSAVICCTMGLVYGNEDVMKTLMLLFIIFLGGHSHARFLSPIIDPEAEGRYAGISVMTADHLIYQTEKDQVHHLWSMDLDSQAKQNLISSNHRLGFRQLQVFGDAVYFVSIDEHNDRHLWRTDGSPANTRQISTEPLGGSNGQFTIRGNQLFTTNPQNQLLQLFGDQLVKRPVTVSSINHICVFSADHLIVQTGSGATGEYTFKRIQDGTTTNVYQYQAVNNFQAAFTAFRKQCYFRYHDADDGLTIIQIPLEGPVTPYTQPADLPPVKHLFGHQNRLYVLAGNGHISNQMFRLTVDLSSFDASATLNEQFSFGEPGFFGDKLVSVATQNNFEPFSTYVVLDADLNILPRRYNYFQFAFGGGAVNFGADLLLGTDALSDDDAVLERFKANGELETLSIKDHHLSHLVGNSTDFYLALSPDALGTLNLYALTDHPLLGPEISGAWIEPDIINQGLVVQHGQREDGSQYVFTTLYGMDDEEPLWLAGNNELTVGQQRLNMDLYQYDGLTLLETDATPSSTLFGQLQLEMTGCDQLSATITSPEQNHTLSLSRVDDRSYKHLCADIQPLTLDQPPAAANQNLGVPHE
jgi:ELWxxDGT repeat protein